MKSFRKNFDGQWKVVTLSDKEVAEIEAQSMVYIRRIHSLMGSEGLGGPVDQSYFLEIYESFANDLIEAKWKAYKAKQKEAESYKGAAPGAPPQ